MLREANILNKVFPFTKGNKVTHSKVKSYYDPEISSPSLEIKYVVTGEEIYIVAGKGTKVSANQLLLINPGHEYEVHVDKKYSEGLCIAISHEILQDVLTTLSVNEEQLLDNGGTAVNPGMEFLEKIYSAYDGPVCDKLRRYAAHLNKEGGTGFNTEFFYMLAKDIFLMDQSVKQHVKNLPARKSSTKTELYNRVKYAKALLDECYDTGVTLDDLASEACLSKFYFLRSFKQTFGVTPYQYQLQKKMQHAATLLKDQSTTVSEVALQLGFTDIHSFNKAFKKIHSIPPSKFRK